MALAGTSDVCCTVPVKVAGAVVLGAAGVVVLGDGGLTAGLGLAVVVG